MSLHFVLKQNIDIKNVYLIELIFSVKESTIVQVHPEHLQRLKNVTSVIIAPLSIPQNKE